jgi:alpha-tubulin suppressor-like RCC1 family protein
MLRGRSGHPALIAARSARSAIVALLTGLPLAGCIDAGTFVCERDSQCEWNGEPGLCLAGSCAVFDPDCESNYRFHDRSASDVAGQCADVIDPTATSTSTASDTVANTSTTSTGMTESTTTINPVTDGSASTGLESCEGTECACAISVATGLEYTCAARTDGTVVCWGANGNAELGTGETSSSVPYLRQPDFGPNVFIESMVAGNTHTCALSNDGRLFCWGDNSSQQTMPMPEPLEVLPPTEIDFVPGTDLMALAPAHTCAVFDAMVTAQCWGANGYGELGQMIGVTPGPFTTAELGVGPVESMVAGRDHTCAMLDDVVKCWGRNDVGQLGNPAETMPTVDPQTVLLDRNPVHMAAGRDHTCVVVTDGTLRCWGSNAVGQIGDGGTTNAAVPVTPVGPPGRVVQLSGRLDSMCALTEDGDIYCWGDVNGEDLGTEVENGDPLSVPTRVIAVDELPEPIVEVDTGRYHVCARLESGRLWCWGSRLSNQLGTEYPPDGKQAVEINLDCPQ